MYAIRSYYVTVHTIFGWDIRTVIIVTGLVVMIYSTLGGLQAVVWTDAIQGLVLIGGALASVIVILGGMPEGAGQVFSIAAESHKFSLGSFDLGFVITSYSIHYTKLYDTLYEVIRIRS